MSDIPLGKINTIEYDDKIILLIDQRWRKFCYSDLIFDALIDKSGKYVLRGPKVNCNPRSSDLAVVQENTIDE